MFYESPVESLYIHVPFCAHKCEYCAFFSQLPNGETVNRYVNALVRELELVAHDLKPRTIFFGGGTPSLLTLKQWETLLTAMERLNLLGAQEWTVECNPATVSADKAKLLRSFGVNRISMGVQSLDENLLDRLGRIHSREMVFKSYETLRTAGFENINLDLMFAIPGQTMEIWRETMREAMALGSEHLSCYEVIYEEDTPLFYQLKAGKFSVDEGLACDMYEELRAFSASQGFHQYEIANFARHNAPTVSEIPTYACRHNVNYWRGGQFYGLGPSASEYVRGIRAKNWSNTIMYCEQLEKGSRATESKEELAPLARASEIAAFGLRMNAGWPFEEFKTRTGYDLRLDWSAEMENLVKLDYGRNNGERFHLTSTGIRYADWAAEQFLKV
ncbi:MAG: radical SAM family heme chaperone HemW [Verrucomicrobia bacterium]|nr:radical SAM family heme chaperone HemW [Verrucomicrobiota bacterium]